ncbi:MAG: hypothetical protein ABFS32_10600 [Bacteroidota bacterium]
MKNFLELEYSAWFILLCLVLGVAYSFIQYDKKAPWSKNINWSLAVLRAIVVSFLSILLLGPMIRALKNYYEKPILALAIDNSQSIAMTVDSASLLNLKSNLKELSKQLDEHGWETVVFNINGVKSNIDSIDFIETKSNLTRMVRSVQSEYEGGNLAGILVVSDGIFNTGYSPDLISTLTPIYSLGVGDTIQKKDLSIIDVKHNQTVYQDNKFPVEVSIRNDGIGPSSSLLKIYQGNQLMDQKKINFLPETRLVQHLFQIDAEDPGKQRIRIVLAPLDDESTSANNEYNFYIDVVEGQQKILIVSDAPVPDIKAVRLAIEQNENIKVALYGEGTLNLNTYDLIILMQLPNAKKSNEVYREILSTDIPKLYFVGSLTDISRLKSDAIFNITHVRNQYDQVTVNLNKEFTGFTLVDEMDEWLSDVPPIHVPFGDISMPPNSQVVLFQKVGNIATHKPVLYFAEEGTRFGVFVGDGLWKWRLNEYYRYGETTRFDELVSKAVMYLAAKPDKRQFKLYPAKSGYEVGENIKFTAETYNELFEPLFGEQVTIQISKDEDVKSYTFTPMEGSQDVSLDILDEGIYDYKGFTTLNGVKHQVSGQFTVDNPNIEAAELTADFSSLSNLSLASGGRFYTMTQMEAMMDDLQSLDVPSVIHTRDKEILLLNLPWILALIILIVSGEWLIRKMFGGY